MLYYLSSNFLTSRKVLWSLFIVNLLGTIYGYEWYWNQIQFTMRTGHPLWQLIFVPDSPTASLFFTLSLGYLLFRPAVVTGRGIVIRSLIEAYGAVASVKYGIWAVTMIFADAALGGSLDGQEWMLVGSHLGMAVEACLFTAFLSFGRLSAVIAALAIFLNDYMDYTYGIYPWLTKALEVHLIAVRDYTVCLSGFSLLLICLLVQRRHNRQRQQSGLLSRSPS